MGGAKSQQDRLVRRSFRHKRPMQGTVHYFYYYVVLIATLLCGNRIVILPLTTSSWMVGTSGVVVAFTGPLCGRPPSLMGTGTTAGRHGLPKQQQQPTSTAPGVITRTVLTSSQQWYPMNVQRQRQSRPSNLILLSWSTSPTKKSTSSSSSRPSITTRMATKDNDANNNKIDDLFDIQTTVSLVGGQSALIAIAAIIGAFIGTPNCGLGPHIDFSPPSLWEGLLWSAPLGIISYGLDLLEDRFVPLQDVSKATQRSILTLLGGTFKPLIGFVTAGALAVAAGLGEEMLFRGVLQYELLNMLDSQFFALVISSVVFGALHAVTPLYAVLAFLASLYFGWMYLSTGNLAVPIATHAFYDWVAVLYAHYEVTTQMSDEERLSLLKWSGPVNDERRR